MYICIYIYIYTHIYIIYTYTFMYTCIYIYIYISVHIQYVCIYICEYTCMYIYVYTCKCLGKYQCICIYRVHWICTQPRTPPLPMIWQYIYPLQCYISEVDQIKKLRCLDISRYKFKLKSWWNLTLYRKIGVSQLGGFRGNGTFSGLCHRYCQKSEVLEVYVLHWDNAFIVIAGHMHKSCHVGHINKCYCGTYK